jgi:hypothetical protein
VTTTKIMLDHVLAQTPPGPPSLDTLQSDVLKPAARFWLGTQSYKLRKAECAQALEEMFQDPARVQAGLRSLPPNQHQILAVVQRYGGLVSGTLLASELRARGLVEKTRARSTYYGRKRDLDPVDDLCAKLLLLPRRGSSDPYVSRASWDNRHQYRDLFLHPALHALVETLSPLPWQATEGTPAPQTSYQRSAAEVVLDLMTIAQALNESGAWKTNRGGSPAKSMQNRLHKALAADARDPLLPTAPESLYYEILRGLGAVRVERDQGTIHIADVERHLCGSALEQSRQWVRAWLHARLWQDGLGVVPDRESQGNSVRIDPHRLATARELVVWALCRVAHGTQDWIDLETFLADLWSIEGEDSLSFYCHTYTWKPVFARARDKMIIKADPDRQLAFWLDDTGIWAANAILGTLVHLGLVERGHTNSSEDSPSCFRLTETGRAVFGAPELVTTATKHDPKFLTLQPNHEMLAYLDAADAQVVWPLARMARRVAPLSGRVQTFALTRESVYQALESGWSLEAIREFLGEHSKTGLPENVAHSLAEWGRKREAIVIRTEVNLGAVPAGQTGALPGAAQGQSISADFVLLPRTATHDVKSCFRRDYASPVPHRPWHVDEEGFVRFIEETDAVVLARLAQFADPRASGWQITAASVRRARERGIPVDQILGWLEEHLVNEIPPLVETMIRNWASYATRVFLGPLWIFQVQTSQASAAVLTSRQFRPFLVAHIPPDWFIVHAPKLDELERLLAETGFERHEFVVLEDGTRIALGRVESMESSPERSSREGRMARPEE